MRSLMRIVVVVLLASVLPLGQVGCDELDVARDSTQFADKLGLLQAPVLDGKHSGMLEPPITHDSGMSVD